MIKIDEAAYRRLVLGETRGMLAACCRVVLWPLSVPHGIAVGLRNRAFDKGWASSIAAPVPVFCVGNLTVGGTGKTPMVEYFARRFRERGIRVAILSRGYGAADGPNDESLVLGENLPDVPHLQNRDRVASARVAVNEFQSQLLLLDDGFQHRRMKRDLDVVLLDATAPFGGGRLLPAGLLREPLAGLRRAGLVVLTRCDAVDESRRQEIRQQVRSIADLPWAEVRFAPTLLCRVDHDGVRIEDLSGKRILSFCGIGNPSAFQSSLEKHGGIVLDFRSFPDHHNYSGEDLSSLARWADANKPDMLVTTQKDLVKLRVHQLGGVPLYALHIAAVVEVGVEAIDAAVDQMVDRVDTIEPQ